MITFPLINHDDVTNITSQHLFSMESELNITVFRMICFSTERVETVINLSMCYLFTCLRRVLITVAQHTIAIWWRNYLMHNLT